MEPFYNYSSSTTSNSKGKRKHYDDEAQAMADEFDDWKKQRTVKDVASSMSSSDSSSVQQHILPFLAAPAAGDISSVRTERSSFMESNNSSDDMMEVEDVSMSLHEAFIPSNQQGSHAQNSWSMLNLKEWRRSQESAHNSMTAQQEIKRMWRNSNASSDRDENPHNP
jgi:hypothetical protein